MEYRSVGKTGWNVSILSYGCMRFKDADSSAAAIRKAVEMGVNYFDVAPAYCRGESEGWVGAGLKGLRDKAIVTAKSSPGNGGEEIGSYDQEAGFGIRTADEARRQIERSMTLLGVDHLDMYQFWALHSEAVFQEGIKPGGFLDGVLKARDEGLIDYIGMTTHSESDEIIHFLKDSPYEFDMVTLPFHLVKAGRTEAIEYCASRGIGVVAMNPLGGGRLARTIPLLKAVAEEAGFGTLVEPALRFVAYQPGVTTALNGMSFIQHVLEGIAAVGKGPLGKEFIELLQARLDEIYRHVNNRHLCTACGYCGECPQGILIPKVLEAYVGLRIPRIAEATRVEIARQLGEDPIGFDPSLCDACGQCQAKCPNKIPVVEIMAAAKAVWPKRA